MLLLAMAVTLTAGMFGPQQVQLREAENQLQRVQARTVQRAVLDEERHILRLDAMAHGHVTVPDGLWSHPLSIGLNNYLKLADTLLVRTIDAQSRFNLANLAPAGGIDDTQVQVYERLLRQFDIDPALARRTAHAIAAGQYRSQAAHAQHEAIPCTHLDDLLAIPGYTARTLAVLRDYVVMLPEPTSINVNTASLIVLAAVLPREQAETLFASRRQAYLRNASDIALRLHGAAPPAEARLDVTSAYFLVEQRITLGRASLATETLIQRRQGNRFSQDDVLPTAIIWTRNF